MRASLLLPRIGLLVAGVLVGYVAVERLARHWRVPASESLPDIDAPVAARFVPATATPVEAIPPAPIDPPSEVDPVESMVEIAREATPMSASKASDVIGARLRANHDLVPRTVARASELFAAQETVAAEILAVAATSVPDLGPAALLAALERVSTDASVDARVGLIRACCRWDFATPSGSGGYVGVRRGLLTVVGGPLASGSAVAVVLRHYDEALPPETRVRIEALWGLSGEIGREDVASRVAQSMRPDVNAAERDVATTLAMRVVRSGLPTRALVEAALKSSLPPEERAALAVRSDLEEAVRLHQDLDGLLQRLTAAESIAQRVAVADALADSSLLHRASLGPGGDAMRAAATALARDDSRTVRRAGTRAVGELLRAGSWSSAELSEELFRLLLDPGLDPESQRWIASELMSMAVGTRMAEDARTRIATLVRSPDTPNAVREALLGELHTLTTNDSTFATWRDALLVGAVDER